MARSGRGQPPHWPSRQFRFQLIAAPIPFEQIQAANNFGIMHLRLLTLFMLFLAVAQLFCEDNLREDDDLWTTNDHVQHGWPSSDPFREILLRMTRKPRPHQFVGLMGRRSMANSQIPRKRHKVNSFVGLMGKRSQEEPDSYDWTTVQMDDARR
ncbi:protachykinin-1 isoform X2 [Dunckerocampus dactyliophorus]|uniref:protachykinin-1 isoform X2 n=1 Tax=Dunckerocampus dactyliophorus TaxID=161453 RepID=UPI002405AAAD|nr:protachykinin-1 isoform X2 [Dunckerocampus dactyliophorus]